MEELRSTEILDREIQEDARRKAEKILKTSEAECDQILSDTHKRIETVGLEKKAEYARLLDSYIRDAESAVPLEKQRRRVSFVDSSVGESLERWLDELGSEKRFSLYGRMLSGFQTVLRGETVRAYYKGSRETDVRSLISSALPESSCPDCVPASGNAKSSFEFSEGILVETENKSILCRATREELLADLLTNKRQELSEALLGGRIPS